MPAVSIVVPVYNAERFLERCLGSLKDQTLEDLEIVCVDDASTDGSLQLLQTLASEDPRIRVLHSQTNHGASVSRNIGIDASTGDYVAFLDSDDRVAPYFYRNLYAKAVADGCDIVKGTINIEDPVTGRLLPAWHGMDLDHRIFTQSKAYFLYGFTSAIFKRELLVKNDIRFPEGLIINEDPVFTSKAVLLAEKIGYVKLANYYYLANPDSASHKDATARHLESQVKGSHMILDMLEANGADPRHYVIVSMLLMDHLLFWCKRLDVPVSITEQAATAFDEFYHRTHYSSEVLRHMFLYRCYVHEKKHHHELLEMMRNKMKKDA